MLTEDQQKLFTRLWTEAQPAVSRYVASVIPDFSAAKDIVQTTSLALLEKFSEYDPERPFVAWALGIAKFEILSYRRDAARSRIIFDSDLFDHYTNTWAELAQETGGDEANHLRTCLDELPERQLELIRLRYFENLNSKVIGERLKKTSISVRTQLKRTRIALRDCVVQRQKLAEKGAL